jgi:hypothetical protein
MNWGMVAAREHAKRIKREVDQLLGSRSYNLFLQLMNPQFALNSGRLDSGSCPVSKVLWS